MTEDVRTRGPSLFTPVLLVGCVIVLVGFAIRASFGVFQIPIEEEFGWPRSEFSLAIAIQNLAWGFGSPFFGAFSEKLGDRKAIVLGAVLYSLGLVLTQVQVLHSLFSSMRSWSGSEWQGLDLELYSLLLAELVHPSTEP